MRNDFYKDLTPGDISKYIAQAHQDIGKDFEVVETDNSSISCGYKRFDIKLKKKVPLIFDAYNYFYFFSCHVNENNTDWVTFMAHKAGGEYVKAYEEWIAKEHESAKSNIIAKYNNVSERYAKLEDEKDDYDYQVALLRNLEILVSGNGWIGKTLKW
jgi:hypothetical protein